MVNTKGQWMVVIGIRFHQPISTPIKVTTITNNELFQHKTNQAPLIRPTNTNHTVVGAERLVGANVARSTLFLLLKPDIQRT